MRDTSTIRKELADTRQQLDNTNKQIARKQVELSTLRKETAALMQPHVGANKVPSSVSLRRDQLGKLHADLDLLTTCSELAQEAITGLEAELAASETAEAVHAAGMRLTGLTAAHSELAAALADLDALIQERVKAKILPALKRLQEHDAGAICAAMQCSTIEAAWERHPDIVRQIIATLQGLPALAVNLETLEHALIDVKAVTEGGADWCARYTPASIRYQPTPPPQPLEELPATAWKPRTVEEAKRFGLLWTLPNGKKIIVSHGQLASLQKAEVEERERLRRLELAEMEMAKAEQGEE